VTVYNRWFNPATKQDEFHRKVLTKAHWMDVDGVSLDGKGVAGSSVAEVLIDGSLSEYVTPNIYYGLSKAAAQLVWTLSPADIICKGNVSLTISKPTDLKHLDNVRTIVSASYVDQGLRKQSHHEVIAR
jgi:hypothetical protein